MLIKNTSNTYDQTRIKRVLLSIRIKNRTE